MKPNQLFFLDGGATEVSVDTGGTDLPVSALVTSVLGGGAAAVEKGERG